MHLSARDMLFPFLPTAQNKMKIPVVSACQQRHYPLAISIGLFFKDLFFLVQAVLQK